MEIRKLEPIAQKARTLLLKSTQEKLRAILDNPNHEFRRTKPEAVRALVKMVDELGEQAIVDKVAYTWFNRFIALRFMDVRSYNPVKVLSANENETQIEIISLAENGVYNSRLTSPALQQEVSAIFSDGIESGNKYKSILTKLIVGACNKYSETMPFLFQKMDDYSELLIPDDLVSDDSVLALIRKAINKETVQELGVSLIGWLYQFYISERTAEVIGSVIETPDIPAATQFFTPEWIVRYLVDNTLGRVWMEKNPDEEFQTSLEYYIPGQQPVATSISNNVTMIRFLDPCCGSGHVLVYAFDVFAKIYTLLGYSQSDIPGLILKNNLVGLELDERAAEMAGFCLVMKAMEYDRSFLVRSEVPIPNVTVISKIHFRDNDDQLPVLASRLASEETTAEQILELFHLFENADAVASLIVPALTLSQLDALYSRYQVHKDDFAIFFEDKIDKIFLLARLLADQYDVVVTNPPYMGSAFMNADVKNFVQKFYPNSKSDLFTSFIERCMNFAVCQGYIGLVTIHSWMFLSSFTTLRKKFIEENAFLTMAHAGPRAFDMITGEVVQTTAFTMTNQPIPGYLGVYIRLIDGNSESEKMAMFKDAIRNPSCGWFYQTDSSDFEKIPGSPIVYWVNENIRNSFQLPAMGGEFDIRAGISTGNNASSIFYWYEVSNKFIKTDNVTNYKYTHHNKGGEYRKWYGNQDNILKYSPEFIQIMEQNPGFRHDGKDSYFNVHVGWSKISSGPASFRLYDKTFTFDSAGLALLANDRQKIYNALCFLNSKVSIYLLSLLNPTLNLTPIAIKNLPWNQQNNDNVQSLISLSRRDWDSYETSWGFECNPLVTLAKQRGSQSVLISDLYQRLREQWRADTAEMKRLEEENNRIFIDAYGLQDELSPEVPLSEVSLTCNPAYRYKLKSNEDSEKRLEQDAVKELLSYAVGCMMGRYSLDCPGLILADQGSTEQDYRTKTGSDYPIDPDGIIPMFDDNFRQDDIIKQLYTFLIRAFGESTLHDNVSYMETVLDKDIRKYFQKDFFMDHKQTYKNRPIYWFFTSSKGGFSCLMYMHRYFPDTCSRILNQYLRLYMRKLSNDKASLESQLSSGSLSAVTRNSLVKNVERIDKLLSELTDYERNALNRHAGDRIELDLDDGVKVNYVKFYPAVKKVI